MISQPTWSLHFHPCHSVRASSSWTIWLRRPMEQTRCKQFLIALAIAFSVLPVVNSFRKPHANKDYSHWYAVGKSVIASKPLYPSAAEEFSFLYPPFGAVCLLAPLSLLPFPVFVAVFALTNTLAWLGCIYYSVRLVSGSWVGQPVYLYLIPALVSLPFVWDTFILGQWNLMLLFLMLAAFLALQTNHPVRGGVCIALAAAIKAFPILAASWLLWRRQWRALGGLLMGLVFLLVLLPGCMRGFDANLSELHTWFEGMVVKQCATEIGQRPNIAFSYRNQSLKSVVHRLLRPIATSDADHIAGPANLLSLSPAGAEVVFWLLLAALCLALVLQMRRADTYERTSHVIEQGMLLCLIVFVSPLAWTYFYCWLLLPATIIVDHLAKMPAGGVKYSLIALAVLTLIVLTSALGQSVDVMWPQSHGATACGGLLVFLMLTILGRSARRSESLGKMDLLPASLA